MRRLFTTLVLPVAVLAESSAQDPIIIHQKDGPTLGYSPESGVSILQ